MDLPNFSAEEKLALVALLKLCVAADGEVSEEELNEIGQVAAALGDEEYRRLVDEADRRFRNDEDLRAFLRTIGRQEARDTIYGVVLEAAASEALQGPEPELLDWLAEAWGIQVEVVGETEPS